MPESDCDSPLLPCFRRGLGIVLLTLGWVAPTLAAGLQPSTRPGTQPAHTAPAHTAPAHTAPAHTAPAHTAPAHTAPAHTAPASTPGTQAVEPEGPDLRLRRFALANGVRGLLLRDPAAPMVGVFALIRAGVMHEGSGEDGLSHFLEHLLFNGTQELSQEDLYAAVDRLGGYSNATTRADHTLFQMLVPAQHLERALAIHAGMLLDSTLPADKLEKERGIVLEELAKDAAQPQTAIEEAFRRFAFSGTPLARPVIGSAQTLGTIDRERIESYWRRRYVPGNITVLVVGDVAPARMAAALAAAYGTAPARTTEAEPVIELAFGDRAELSTIRATTPRLECIVGWPGPHGAHPDSFALDALATVLTSGPRRKLESLLTAAGVPAGDGSASNERVAGTGLFTIRAHGATGTEPDRLVDAIERAVAIRVADLGSDDLRSVRTRYAVDASFLAEKPHYFGLEKASLLANGGAAAIEGESAAMAQLTVPAVQAAAARWLVGHPFRAVCGGPELTAGLRPRPSAATTTIAATGQVRSRHGRLANGLELSVTSNPGAAVFAVHVLVRDRAAAEQGQPEGLADLVHRLLARRGPAFERDLAAIGAQLKTHDNPWIPYDDYYDRPEFGYLRLETIDAYAPVAADLLATALTPPRPAVADLTAALAAAEAVAATQAQSASERSASLLAAGLFGAEHPLSRRVGGAVGTLAQVDPDAVHDFASAYLAPSRLVVTIHTGRDLEATWQLLAGVLDGTVDAGSTLLATVVATARPSSTQHAEQTIGGAQSYVRIGATIDRKDADRAALELALAIYSERLQADIREQRGMAYSIGAGLSARPANWPASWSAAAGTRADNVDTVVSAMLDILSRLRAQGPTDEELALAASRAEGRALMRHLSAIGRAYFDGLDLWLGHPPGSSLERSHAISQVRAQDVRRALAEHFDPSRIHVAIVR